MVDPGFDSVEGVDRWVARARAKAERYQALKARTGEVVVTEASRDGLVTVTVDSTGNLTDLRITDRVRELSGAEVAAAVLAQVRRAQAKLPEKVRQVMDATIADDPATIATVVGAFTERFPEPPPEEPADAYRAWRPADGAGAPPPRKRVRGPDEEDDGWVDQSVLDE
ncbi:YbaB/EbfC family nucleoid-associated protein [Actinosynnema sp. NPDC020468]|uniref:YbaB/EbfC family nucleoid-associated protein n=1 Tax=Actinosynnema sp. NPDC020468 TaxID=3154488 RepID=UPI0033D570A8